MSKKLIKHGNSLALIIDKPILKMLGINKNTQLIIRTDGERVIIETAEKHISKTSNREQALKRIYDEIVEKYSVDLKKLAE